MTDQRTRWPENASSPLPRQVAGCLYIIRRKTFVQMNARLSLGRCFGKLMRTLLYPLAQYEIGNR